MSQFISPELVSKLTSASERIRRATDDLAQSVSAVEEFLASLDLGIPAVVWVEHPDAPHRLIYGPDATTDDAPRWTLRIERVAPGSVTGDGATPTIEAAWRLAEAPPRLRLAAATAVPNLVESIASAAAEEADRIEEAIARLRGPADEITIVDSKTREQLDRDFLEHYSRRMADERAKTARK